ncbi:poly(A)-specific ribonuclease PARN-like [Asterias rubens]|uniref:poly(A)-specific ribonuclease PARN-like n=1 Tax=Asterias rubens TaxID=7604 RepID=UPI0014559A82|nr:poly(A)-specific ribonuclease PARN-like [Asterias rubens]
MEVTKKNFKEVLKKLPSILNGASFIAIDGEFTGLHHEVRPSPYDTPEERYDKLRKGSMDFLLMQFGMCVFKYEKQKSRYVVHPFNFYVFPHPVSNRKPDHRFLCQSSSIDFLTSFNFDFNKVFRDGIPYLTHAEKESMKEHVREKHVLFEQQAMNSEQSPGFISPMAKKPVEIPAEQKDFIDAVCKKVDDFVNNSEEATLKLEPCTGFQRKLTFQSVKARHASGLMLTTKAGENKGDRYIEVAKATDEDKRNMLKKKLESDLDDVEDAAGFSKVIDLISSTGKPVVGHNIMLDVMHVLHQFSCQLPETLSEFKELVSCVFPKLLDTKVMAGTQPFKDQIPFTGLCELERTLKCAPFTQPECVTAPGYPTYSSETDKSHEAGYDAFITGTCFATMANYLGTFLDPPRGRVTPTCNLIEPFHNKMSLFRVQDLPYINLTGPDLTPSRDHVFHITFPSEWRTHDIQNLFAPFSTVFINWIDNSSAFVCLNNRDESKLIMKNIEQGPDHRVQTYKDYRRSLHNATPDSSPMVAAQPSTSDTGVVTPSEAAPFRTPRGLKRTHDSSEVRGHDPEVAELTAAAAKKQKSMDPNAPVFVSRRSVSPVEVSSTSPQTVKEADQQTIKSLEADKDSAGTEMKDGKKLFDEPTSW